MARIKDTSRRGGEGGGRLRRRRLGADAAPQGGAAATRAAARSTRSARRRSRSTRVDKLYYCFGCGAKGDLITFVRETEGLDFAGSIEWLGERFRVAARVRGELAGAGRRAQAPRAALRAARPGGDVLRAHALGDGGRRRWRATTSRAAASNEDACREFRLGLALGGDSLARKALAKGFTREELRAAGLTRQRGDDYFPRRLLFPLADARGRVLGFQARKLLRRRPAEGEVREHARVGALPQGLRSSTGSTRRGPRSRGRTARASSRATPT